MRTTIGRWDRRLMRRSARLSTPSTDRALRGLSRGADHGVLWFALAGLLWLRRGQVRRGAIRGVAALGMASFAANVLGKPLVPRRRPAGALVPAHRRLSSRPASSAFPSGHAASAAAFGMGVALESPPAGLAVLPLSAAVAYSRVHTGVHWPSDVAAGATLGVTAALVTKHFSPVREDSPVRLPPAAPAPALGAGERLLFVVNPSSGDEDESPEDDVRARWPKSRVLLCEPGMDLVAEVVAALDTQRPDALGVAGGDGTVAAIAGLAVRYELPLVVLPEGTLNHFARDAGCDGEPFSAAASGVAAALDMTAVGVDGAAPRWVLNTASLGVYPDLVQVRERLEHRIGKWPAAAVALFRVLRGVQPLRLTVDGETHAAWLLFVGNNAYLPAEFTPGYRPSMASGAMDVRIVLADGPWSRLRFAVSALTGSMHSTPTYRRRTAETLTVHSAEPVRLATDGEVGPLGTEFGFAVHRGSLRVYRDLS